MTEHSRAHDARNEDGTATWLDRVAERGSSTGDPRKRGLEQPRNGAAVPSAADAAEDAVIARGLTRDGGSGAGHGVWDRADGNGGPAKSGRSAAHHLTADGNGRGSRSAVPDGLAAGGNGAGPSTFEDFDEAIGALHAEALEVARRDAAAELPNADLTGCAESERELRQRCAALFERWQARERDRLNAIVAATEEVIVGKLGRVGLALDRSERIANELFRLRARWEMRREQVKEELEAAGQTEVEHEKERGFATRWYALAIGFLGLVEFLANAPVFGALLPRDPLTEQQIRRMAELSEGWLAGAARVVSQFVLRPDAALLAAGVVTFLCVLAHFFGQSLRHLLVQSGSRRMRATRSSRSAREYVVPMLLSGVGLMLVLGVLYQARITLGQVAEDRYAQDAAKVEELRRTASWLRVDGDLVAANQQANQADDLQALANEQLEYARSMSGLSFPVFLLNSTLVLVAICASYFHTRDRRRERFNDDPFEEERRTYMELGDTAAQEVVETMAQLVRHIRALHGMLTERPMRDWPSVLHRLEAVVAGYRAESGRLRGLDPRAVPAFAEPVRLELTAAGEEERPLLMRDPAEYEEQRRALEERFEGIRERFTKEATAW